MADRRDEDTLAELPELALCAPEAAQADQRTGVALRVGALERPAEAEMALRSPNRRRAAGERLLLARHLQLLLEPEHDGLLCGHAAKPREYSVGSGSPRHQNADEPRSRCRERLFLPAPLPARLDRSHSRFRASCF